MNQKIKHCFSSDTEYQQHIARMKSAMEYLTTDDLNLIALDNNIKLNQVNKIRYGTRKNIKVVRDIVNNAIHNKDLLNRITDEK